MSAYAAHWIGLRHHSSKLTLPWSPVSLCAVTALITVRRRPISPHPPITRTLSQPWIGPVHNASRQLRVLCLLLRIQQACVPPLTDQLVLYPAEFVNSPIPRLRTVYVNSLLATLNARAGTMQRALGAQRETLPLTLTGEDGKGEVTRGAQVCGMHQDRMA